MTFRRSLIVCLFCVFELGEIGVALKCYTCASHKHGEEICGEAPSLRPTDRDFIVDCEHSCKLAYLENIHSGIKVYARMCGETPVQDCEEKLIRTNYTGKNCQCRTDFCNLNWEMPRPEADGRPVQLEVRNSAMAVKMAANVVFGILMIMLVS